jgi:D-alanyl-lipoteichoic acid acyltransferase DltB (MBOAT superfamily)
MLFNATTFLLLFLPLTLLGWWTIRGERKRLAFLVAASYVFYVLFDFPTGLKLLPLLVAATLIDYVGGQIIAAASSARVRNAALVTSLCMNLGMLGFFKYLGFFEQILDAVAGAFGHAGAVPITDVVLPLGISFYTFNSMSYTIDLWRGRVQPAKSVVHYAAFVALFPHLVAGPIVRFADLDTQLRSLPRRLASSTALTGCAFLAVGLCKKVVIADLILAPTIDRLYLHSGELGMVSGLVAILGYSVQLFFDFSAYSEMAVGIALLMGFRFPQNFDSPFRALDMADFWRRWHITLGAWVRDYLYIPLGGSRGSTAKVLQTSFLTMFIVGLWHGAAWTFVCFGVGHGLAMAVHTAASKFGYRRRSVPTAWLTTLATWTSLAVFIKAPNMSVAGEVLSAAVGANGMHIEHLARSASTGAGVPWTFVFVLFTFVAVLVALPNVYTVLRQPMQFPRMRTVALTAAGASGLLFLQAPSAFLYFQF